MSRRPTHTESKPATGIRLKLREARSDGDDLGNDLLALVGRQFAGRHVVDSPASSTWARNSSATLALNASVDSVSGGCRVMLVEVRRCGVYSQVNGARAPKRSIPILKTGGQHGVMIG